MQQHNYIFQKEIVSINTMLSMSFGLMEFSGSRSGEEKDIPLLGVLGVFTTKPSTT